MDSWKLVEGKSIERSKLISAAVIQLRGVESLLSDANGIVTGPAKKEARTARLMLDICDPLRIYRRNGGASYKIVRDEDGKPCTQEIETPDGSQKAIVTELDTSTAYEAFSDEDKALSNLCESGAKLMARIADGDTNPDDLGGLKRITDAIEAWPASVVEKAIAGDTEPQTMADTMSPRNKALALVREHPDWTYDQIADAVGRHKSTVKRWPEIKELKRMNRQYTQPPRGYKNTDGDIEASSDW